MKTTARTDRRIIATLLLASTLTVMAGATIAPAQTAMRDAFLDTPAVDLLVRLAVTLPALAIALSARLAGSLADRIGRRRLLSWGAGLYAVAGASGLVLPTLPLILAGRAVLGLAVAAIMTSATALIGDYFDDERRSQVLGWQAGMMAFGGTVFLLLGGGLAELGWRLPFAIYLAPIALLPLLVRLPAPPERTGAVGAAPAVVPWRAVLPICALASFGMIAFYLLPTQLPFYLERLGISGGIGSGVLLAMVTSLAGIASLSYGRLSRGLSHQATMVLAFGLLAAGYAVVGAAGGIVWAVAGLVVAGPGAGLLLPTFNGWVSELVAPERRGAALGALTAAVFLGQFVSPLASQPIADAANLSAAFLVFAVGAAVVGAAVVVFQRRAPRSAGTA